MKSLYAESGGSPLLQQGELNLVPAEKPFILSQMGFSPADVGYHEPQISVFGPTTSTTAVYAPSGQLQHPPEIHPDQNPAQAADQEATYRVEECHKQHTLPPLK